MFFIVELDLNQQEVLITLLHAYCFLLQYNVKKYYSRIWWKVVNPYFLRNIENGNVLLRTECLTLDFQVPSTPRYDNNLNVNV